MLRQRWIHLAHVNTVWLADLGDTTFLKGLDECLADWRLGHLKILVSEGEGDFSFMSGSGRQNTGAWICIKYAGVQLIRWITMAYRTDRDAYILLWRKGASQSKMGSQTAPTIFSWVFGEDYVLFAESLFCCYLNIGRRWMGVAFLCGGNRSTSLFAAG